MMWLVVMILSLATATTATSVPGAYVSGPYADLASCQTAGAAMVNVIMGNPLVKQWSTRCWASEVEAKTQASIWSKLGPLP